MHKAQNYFSLNAKYEASETFVDRRPQHCRLSCGKQLRHRGANTRLQLLQQGVRRFSAGLRLGLLLPEEAHSTGLPTSPRERCCAAASKVFLRAKKLWVNPPKAERAKPSLSPDYNLRFKNKIGERSLDIHRGQIPSELTHILVSSCFIWKYGLFSPLAVRPRPYYSCAVPP